MYKLVVFDLDGTLANTVEDLANATNYGLEKAGLKTYPVEDYKQMVGSGIVNLVKRAMSPETDEKIFDIVKGGFDYYYNAHSIDKTTPYEGTEKLLNDLEEKGIKYILIFLQSLLSFLQTIYLLYHLMETLLVYPQEKCQLFHIVNLNLQTIHNPTYHIPESTTLWFQVFQLVYLPNLSVLHWHQ